MSDLTPAARAAYDAIAMSNDGLTASDVPMPNKGLGTRAAVLGELVQAGLIRFAAGRYRKTEDARGNGA